MFVNIDVIDSILVSLHYCASLCLEMCHIFLVWNTHTDFWEPVHSLCVCVWNFSKPNKYWQYKLLFT